MSNFWNVEWENVDELKAAMDELSKKDYNNLMKEINKQLAQKYIVERIRQGVPYSGDSKKQVRVVAGSKNDRTAVAAGPTSEIFWWRFVEGGTKERTGRGSISPQNRIGPIIDAQIEPIVGEWQAEVWNMINEVLEKRIKRNVKKLEKLG